MPSFISDSGALGIVGFVFGQFDKGNSKEG